MIKVIGSLDSKASTTGPAQPLPELTTIVIGLIFLTLINDRISSR